MTDENVKFAVVLRSARAALGWGQKEFAEKMGVSPTTLARVETLEVGARADFAFKAVMLFQEAGVNINLFQGDKFMMEVTAIALSEAQRRMKDADNRRPDRNQPKPRAAKGGGKPAHTKSDKGGATGQEAQPLESPGSGNLGGVSDKNNPGWGRW